MKENIRPDTQLVFPEQNLGPLLYSLLRRELRQHALGKKIGQVFWSFRKSVPKLASEGSLRASVA